MNSHQREAITYVQKKLGANRVLFFQNVVYFRLYDGSVVTRHLLSVSREFRTDNRTNEVPSIDPRELYE